MAHTNKLKIFNDPIYGFIGTPNELIFKLIGHPHFQRLRRISQMGLSHLVYPGAHHTRFHHALGCMHLMQKTIAILRYKNVPITAEEENALLIAILLHDIGHGPYSHALEHHIISIGHEAISLAIMEQLNIDFNGDLGLAITIFKGEYDRKFMNQLVSSQLDMDRLDYLKRDSFYAGVTEGNINSERLIQMLNVVNNELVVEEKGVYAVEKFLLARRFMYWQVYLHKTSLAAEQILIRIVERAKLLLSRGEVLHCSNPLLFFLKKEKSDSKKIEEEDIKQFFRLDDTDILSALKSWESHKDQVISKLCNMILNRLLPMIEMQSKAISVAQVTAKKTWVKGNYDITLDDADNFVFQGSIQTSAYNLEEQPIKILTKKGKLVDIVEASSYLDPKILTQKVRRFYWCYPKDSV